MAMTFTPLILQEELLRQSVPSGDAETARQIRARLQPPRMTAIQYVLSLLVFIVVAFILQFARSYYESNALTDGCWWADAEWATLHLLLLAVTAILIAYRIRAARRRPDATAPQLVAHARAMVIVCALFCVLAIIMLFYPAFWTLYFVMLVPMFVSVVYCLWPVGTTLRLLVKNPGALMNSSSSDSAIIGASVTRDSTRLSLAPGTKANTNANANALEMVQPPLSPSGISIASADSLTSANLNGKLSSLISNTSAASGQFFPDDPNAYQYVDDEDPLQEELRREQDRLEQAELGAVTRLDRRFQKRTKIQGTALVLGTGGIATMAANSRRVEESFAAHAKPASAIAAAARHKARLAAASEAEATMAEAEPEDELEQAFGEEDVVQRPGSIARRSVAERPGRPSFSAAFAQSTNKRPSLTTNFSTATTNKPPKGLVASVARSESTASNRSARSYGQHNSVMQAERVAADISLPPGVRPSTLKQVLASVTYIEIFKQFSLGVYCSENILFFMEVAQFRALSERKKAESALTGEQTSIIGETSLLNKFNEIYDLFISEHALMGVNISSAAREPILKAVQTFNAPVEAFDLAQKEVLKLMLTDTWPKFKQLVLSKPATEEEVQAVLDAVAV
ncbi:hypothetical protein, variant [Capsaspora owczarzaki ATCC 30864]|nr:hypothetical protein, variant [Capsaspora owczarzaki ATCC 30864]|eukprot:XP_011270369.1 hypothetical protein, variant [Capsaspora owczarzaki ATCC 30864]